jgi:hypothetical protein
VEESEISQAPFGEVTARRKQWRGYKVMELIYRGYTDGKRDELYQEILKQLGKE